MNKICLCLLLQLCVLTVSQRTALDMPPYLQIYREIRRWIFENFGGRNEQRSFSTVDENKIQEEIPANVPFPCNLTDGRSAEVPDSVHRLRPGDIDVIASIGDSLTAGVGIFAKNLLELPVENRGASALIGGEGNWRKYLTIPNILKEYNPKLIGYSLGDSVSTESEAQLNVAEGGAMSEDLPFMTEKLIDKIYKDPRIDIQKHWKFVALFMGNNDICLNICDPPSPWAIFEKHKVNLIKSLRLLRDNLPRTFVALIMVTDLKALVDAHETINLFHCYLITQIACGCLFSLQYRQHRLEYFEVIKRLADLEEEIAAYPEFHRNDFTVVAQPSLKGAYVPKDKNGLTDITFFSADCFHISQKGNSWFANNVWNNLLEPVGNKSIVWNMPFKRFLCPTAKRPFLMTSKNS